MNVSTFRNFLAIENLGGARWHPEFNRIVFVYDISGVYQVFQLEIVENTKQWPSRLSFEENRCTDPRYLTDGSILYSTDEGGNENFQLGLVTNDGSQFIISQDSRAKYSPLGVNDEYIFYSANLEDKSKFSLYRHKLPLLTNHPELTFTPEYGIIGSLTISPNKELIAISVYYSNQHTDIFILNLLDGSSKRITAKINLSNTNRWFPIRFIGNDGLLVSTEHESDYLRLAYLSVTGEFSTYSQIEQNFHYDISGYTYDKSNNSSHTYFSINDNGYTRLYRGIFRKLTVEDMEEIQLPGKGVLLSGDLRSYTSSMEINHDGTYMAINFSTSTNPSNIYVINLKTGKSWMATSAATPGLDPRGFIEPSLNDFPSFDGLKVPYFRYIPNSQKPEQGWPALFIIHGGPEAQFQPNFNSVVQFYLNSGFAVIAPNIRGSAGYGRTYMDLDNKEKRLDSIHDIKHLALHIQTNDESIDGSKLIIYGGSYGGYAVLASMTEHPEIWAAGVDIVGMSSLTTFLKNTADWRRKLRESEYGSLDSDFEMLESISPINKIDNIRAPLFIIQGDNDERVPLSESIQMYEKLKSKGIKTELLRFADEGHGVVKLKNRLVTYPRVVEWLKEVLLS